jgi:hypothetical protein
MSKRKAEEVAESIAKRAQSETDAVYKNILNASRYFWYGCSIALLPRDVIKQLHADGKIYYTRLHYVRAYEADTDPKKAAMARKITASGLSMECKSELYQVNFNGTSRGMFSNYHVFNEAFEHGFIIAAGDLLYDLEPQQVMGVIGFFGATTSKIQKQFPHHSLAQVAVQVNALIDDGSAFTIGSVHFLFSFYTIRQVKFIKRLFSEEHSTGDVLELFEVFIRGDSRVISVDDKARYEDMGLIHDCHGVMHLLTSELEAIIMEYLPGNSDELEDFLDEEFECSEEELATTLAEMVTAGLICYMPHEGECVYHAYSELANAQEVVEAKRIWADQPDVRGTVLHAMFYDEEETSVVYDYIKSEKGGRTLQAIQQQFKAMTEKMLFEGLERLTKEGQIYHRDNHFKTTPFVPCKYGAGCYRIHNADHMAEYIHPAVCFTVGEIISVMLSSKHKGKVHLARIIDVNTDSVDIRWFYEVADLKKAIRTQVLDGTHVYSDHIQLHFPIKDIITKVDPDTLNICYTYHFNTNTIVMDHCLD